MKIYVLNIKSRSGPFNNKNPTDYHSAWASKELAYNALVEFMKGIYFTNSSAVNCLLEMKKYKEAIGLFNQDYILSEAIRNECSCQYYTFKIEINELDLKGSAYE